MLVTDVLNLWRQGKAVADPAKWKYVGVAAGSIASLITSALAIASALGYHFTIDAAIIDALAGGIAAVLCLVATGLHVTTSDKIGLPPKRDPEPPKAGGDDGWTNPLNPTGA